MNLKSIITITSVALMPATLIAAPLTNCSLGSLCSFSMGPLSETHTINIRNIAKNTKYFCQISVANGGPFQIAAVNKYNGADINYNSDKVKNFFLLGPKDNTSGSISFKFYNESWWQRGSLSFTCTKD